MENTAPIVIVGSGLAGYMLVKEFRKLDPETPLTLLTEDDGHFYSKPQLSTALTQQRDAAALSMGAPEAMREQLNIQLETDCVVTAIDREHAKVMTTKGEYPYQQLVLALGADKLQPPLQGDALDQMQSVNHLSEYAVFRDWLSTKKRLAILGAGLVGCEFANDLINTQYQVDVIAPDPYPLARFVPKPVGLAVKAALSALGVQWHLCRFPESVYHDNHAISVGMDNMQRVTVDGVLSAIGLTPRVALAKAAGLVVKKGIVVNRQLQTSDPNIYALGDCAEVNGHVLLHIAPLLACARTLARVLQGEATDVVYPAMPIIVKTPACPVVAFPPLPGVQGQWTITGEAPDIAALCHDAAGQLVGFALSGSCLSQRATLLKELPALFK